MFPLFSVANHIHFQVGNTIDDFSAVFNNKAQEFLQATIFIVGIACRLNFGPIYKQDNLELC